MTISLPKDLHDWAEAEIRAGRAKSIDALALQALEDHRRRVESFRASLDAAVSEADRDGWLEGEDVLAHMDDLISRLDADAEVATRE